VFFFISAVCIKLVAFRINRQLSFSKRLLTPAGWSSPL